MRAANYIGNKRSTSLAMDSGRSQLPPKTMEMLLRDIGSPKEIGTSNDAILLSVSGLHSATFHLQIILTVFPFLRLA